MGKIWLHTRIRKLRYEAVNVLFWFDWSKRTKKSKIIPVSTSINVVDWQKLYRNEINCAWRVVNDTAKRGVALIQAYSGSLTRDEEQLQYLLQIVAAHCQAVPQPTKRYLTWLSPFNPSLVFRNLFLILLIIAIAFAYLHILYPFRNFWSAFIFFWCAALSHNIYCKVRLSYLVRFLNKMNKTWMWVHPIKMQKQFFLFFLKIWSDSWIKCIKHLWEIISSASFCFYLKFLSQVVNEI